MENITYFLEKCSKFVSNLYHIFLNTLKKMPLFEMDSIYSIIWNLILAIILIVNIFVGPLQLSFTLDDHYSADIISIVGQRIEIFACILDMIHALNTAYYSKGVFVKERTRIIKYYFKYNFFLDLLIICPLIIKFFQISDKIYLKINFVFVAWKIKILIAKLEDYFQFKEKPQGILNLLKLIFLVFYLAHLSGCGWNFIANWEIIEFNAEDTWMHHIGIAHSQWETKYINSLYFSIVTMVTVGYGDIVPQNSKEKFFSIIIIVLGCGFFAYTLNSVGIILTEMYRVDNEFKFFLFGFWFLLIFLF